MHIFNTIAADPIFQKTYIPNALVNLQGLYFMFYEMDLFLKYQSREFKQFRLDQS